MLREQEKLLQMKTLWIWEFSPVKTFSDTQNVSTAQIGRECLLSAQPATDFLYLVAEAQDRASSPATVTTSPSSPFWHVQYNGYPHTHEGPSSGNLLSQNFCVTLIRSKHNNKQYKLSSSSVIKQRFSSNARPTADSAGGTIGLVCTTNTCSDGSRDVSGTTWYSNRETRSICNASGDRCYRL